MPHGECETLRRVTQGSLVGPSSPRKIHELNIYFVSLVMRGCDRCIEQEGDVCERGEHGQD